VAESASVVTHRLTFVKISAVSFASVLLRNLVTDIPFRWSFVLGTQRSVSCTWSVSQKVLAQVFRKIQLKSELLETYKYIKYPWWNWKWVYLSKWIVSYTLQCLDFI